ncbi:MAG TPA: hypothetical protein PLR18_01405 [bacterium]|nr:hypothetical protein [bacterium]
MNLNRASVICVWYFALLVTNQGKEIVANAHTKVNADSQPLIFTCLAHHLGNCFLVSFPIVFWTTSWLTPERRNIFSLFLSLLKGIMFRKEKTFCQVAFPIWLNSASWYYSRQD